MEKYFTKNTHLAHRQLDFAKRKGDVNSIVWDYLEDIFTLRDIAIRNGSLISGDNSAWNYSEANWKQILQKIARNVKLVEYDVPLNGDTSNLCSQAKYCWCSTYKASSSSNSVALKTLSQDELITKGIGYCQLNVAKFEVPSPTTCKRGQHVLMHSFVQYQYQNQKAQKMQQYLQKGVWWEVCHLCDKERCVNPWHTQFKSHKDNEFDKTLKNSNIDRVSLVNQIRSQILEELNLFVNNNN